MNHTVGSLEFSFEGPHDFRRDFLAELKAQIAPEYREYDPDSNIWTIFKPAVPVFRAVYRKYYIGENQTEMFDEL